VGIGLDLEVIKGFKRSRILGSDVSLFDDQWVPKHSWPRNAIYG